MSLLSILLVLIVVGVVLYLVNQVLPLDATIKKVINVVAILLVVVWIISALFGGAGSVGLGGLHMPRIN